MGYHHCRCPRLWLLWKHERDASRNGEGEDAIFYWFDGDDGWITNGDSVSLSSTDALVEDSSNLYFTNERAIAAVVSTINAAIAAALEPTINPQTGVHKALNI